MIRPATAGDAAAVARLWTEAYVTSEPGGRAEPYSEADYSASAAGGRVSAASRRTGIGAALVELCEGRGRAEGWRAIALWSRPWQAEAHRLYEAHGYRRAPDRDDVDAGGRRLVFRPELG